jgi:hypothetical protein
MTLRAGSWQDGAGHYGKAEEVRLEQVSDIVFVRFLHCAAIP